MPAAWKDRLQTPGVSMPASAVRCLMILSAPCAVSLVAGSCLVCRSRLGKRGWLGWLAMPAVSR